MDPRRLVDDPSAAPWLADQLRTAAAPSPMTAEARVRVGMRLAARLRGAELAPRLSWGLMAAAAAVLALVLSSRLATPDDAPTRVASGSVRAERETLSSAARSNSARAPVEQPALGPALAPQERAVGVAQREVAPSRARAQTSAKGRTKALGRKAAASKPRDEAGAVTPAWLIEARVALATDPGRTLELIRTHRDRRVAVSPELLELTARAVEARDATRAPEESAQ